LQDRHGLQFPTINSWRDTGRLIFGPFSECLWISQSNVPFNQKVDLGIDRHEYDAFFLPFYLVWSCLEGTDTKMVQADACPETLTNCMTPTYRLSPIDRTVLSPDHQSTLKFDIVEESVQVRVRVETGFQVFRDSHQLRTVGRKGGASHLTMSEEARLSLLGRNLILGSVLEP
jgi:hypothetical protein